MAFTQRHHTFKRVDKEIKNLIQQILEMGQVAEQQVRRAVESLKNQDSELAQAVIAGDERLNLLDIQIEQACVTFLTRRQPMSSDMRLVMSLSKAVNDLERIGDEARTVAEQGLAIQQRQGELQGGIRADIKQLAEVVLEQFHATLDSLVQLDVERARQLLDTGGDTVDEVFQDNLRSLSTYIFENGSMVSTMIDVTLALKALKRVADHAENLAEYVIYVVEGRDIRHAH